MADFEDFGTQQAGIDRRRKIAEMLINQGMQQDDGRMIGQHYVAPSPIGYVAKLAQMLVGNNNLSALDKEQGALKQRMNEDRMGAIQRYADLLQGKEGTPTIRESAPASMDAMGPGVPETVRVGAVAPNPKAAMMELLKSQDPSLQQFGMQSMLKGRDTSQAFGKIDPKDYTPESIQKFARTGDHTVLVPAQVVDVHNGIAYDRRNTKPGMLPGIVDATAAIKKAEEDAKILPNVTTASGAQVPMRASDAIGGNQSPMAAESYKGESLLDQLPNESKAWFLERARQTGESRFNVNLQLPNGKVVKGEVDLAAPGSQGKQAIGQSTLNKNLDEKLGTKSGDVFLEGRDAAKTLADSIKYIHKSRDAIKSGAILGGGADFKTDVAKVLNGFGFDVAPDKVSNTEYLRSTLGESVLKRAKSLGTNPTDADARRLDQILGSIGKDPNALLNLLDLQEEMARRGIESHNETVSGIRAPFKLSVDMPEPYVFKEIKPSVSAPGVKPQSRMPSVSEIDAELARRRGAK